MHTSRVSTGPRGIHARSLSDTFYGPLGRLGFLQGKTGAGIGLCPLAAQRINVTLMVLFVQSLALSQTV